ncbi:MAG: hypothetical protein HQL95_00880 [Magnetococcales bacterium]|nr:hypothetical protein [Magnetococcales bacterium]
MKAEMSKDGKMIVVTIPMVVKKRGGRKLIIAPPGMEMAPPRDETLARSVAKAHKWLKMLESGQFPSIRALAEQEKVGESYMAKVLRLTLLAPDIVTAIIDGRQPDVLTWRELMKPFPMLWHEQRERWGIPEPV